MSRAAKSRIHRGSFTQAELALRDEFIQEYSRDRDATQACVRMGFAKSFASRQANDFLMCPYVANGLLELQQACPEITPDFIQEVENVAIVRLADEIRYGAARGLNDTLKSWRLLVPAPRQPAAENEVENTLAETLARFASRVDL